MAGLEQTPPPGSRLLRVAGDRVAVSLSLPDGLPPGRAFIRTNLPCEPAGASPQPCEGVRGAQPLPCEGVRGAQPPVARQPEGAPPPAPLAPLWRDIPLRRVSPSAFAGELPLCGPGVFAFKALYLPDGTDEPLWPDGDDAVVKVAPAWTRRGASIYTAFVRQFIPPAPSAPTAPAQAAASSEAVAALDGAGYAVIPPSGTFRELARRLDHIVGTLGFHIVQLLPIHPVPTTYARMGRFGSPFASLDFYSVDPALAEFDPSATPLEQFVELVDAVHARGARLFLDLPANHTGWASTFQTRHPEWFRRNGDGSFHSPGAWGVTWADLVELDYSAPGLRDAIADVFLFWCDKGVDGFRCDAGYMVPADVWRHVVTRVRAAFPDTVFLLEGLGGRLEVTDGLLADVGLDWAYSEIFEHDGRDSLAGYLPSAMARSEAIGPLVHFAETHDNNRLASRGETYARLRTALAALLSQQGAFGITAGVEWFCCDKIDVHGAPPLNWGAAENQVALVSRLNAILDACPAFAAGAHVEFVTHGGGNVLAALRVAAPGDDGAPGAVCLCLFNLGCDAAARVAWDGALFSPQSPWDLVSSRPVALLSEGPVAAIELPPGGFAALVDGAATLRAVDTAEAARQNGEGPGASPRPCKGVRGAQPPDPLAPLPPPSVPFRFPTDSRRVVMVPPRYGLALSSDVPFRAILRDGAAPIASAVSAPAASGGHAAFLRVPQVAARRRFGIEVVGYGDGPARRTRSEILALPPVERATFSAAADGSRVRTGEELLAVLANRRGALAQVRASWGEIRSQYDALLAVNPDPHVPANRQVFFTRCRAWIRRRGFSASLDASCLESFEALGPRLAVWRFRVPVGYGETAAVEITLELAEDANAAALTVARGRGGMPDDAKVELVLRPDVEARDFHGPTLAYAGPERQLPAAVRAEPDGFRLEPAGAVPCRLSLPGGAFHEDPVWAYSVPHPLEAARGLQPAGDLFSPGWFSVPLPAGGSIRLLAAALGEGPGASPPSAAASLPCEGVRGAQPPSAAASLPCAGVRGAPPPSAAASLPCAGVRGAQPPVARQEIRRAQPPVARQASPLSLYLADRDGLKTVIAGYPWFLDWGRDTLIALRGLLAAGYLEDSLAILREFGRFEERGTLPNIIHGSTVGNRDTSDAPLWFVVAAGDAMARAGAKAVAALDCGGRALREVAVSIVASYLEGTPNGIRVDPASGLVFSPAHFTWMDTNYPAATPRAGYPVEIQALWIAALAVVREGLGIARFEAVERRARASLAARYALDGVGLADSLRTADGAFAPAAEALPEDALRPNQLLAVTLGAIDAASPLAAAVVDATETLLVPGAIRSLADRPVQVPQPVWRDGRLLNDPEHPYWGRYEGDEDTRRKPAYHNGTAWAWLFPSWCEAAARVRGDVAAARALLASSCALLETGCLGQLPEIVDGDAPHTQRGCLAQAWSVTEFERVWRVLAPPRE